MDTKGPCQEDTVVTYMLQWEVTWQQWFGRQARRAHTDKYAQTFNKRQLV